jgi:hypothetical protein
MKLHRLRPLVPPPSRGTLKLRYILKVFERQLAGNKGQNPHGHPTERPVPVVSAPDKGREGSFLLLEFDVDDVV